MKRTLRTITPPPVDWGNRLDPITLVTAQVINAETLPNIAEAIAYAKALPADRREQLEREWL